jgi:hypothetical protein
MTELETFTATLESASRTAGEYRSRLPGVEAAVAEAAAHRKSLNAQKIRGAGIPDKSLKDAGLNIDAAEKALAALQEQIAEAEAYEAEAKSNLEAATLAVNKDLAARLRRAVIQAADKIDLGVKYLVDGLAEREANYFALMNAIPKTGRFATDTERDAYLKSKTNGCCAIPENLQANIIQQGSPIPLSMGQYERGLWLAEAAPDPESDAPYDKAAQAAIDAIESRQALEAAGHKMQMAGVGRGLDWTPDMRDNSVPGRGGWA